MQRIKLLPNERSVTVKQGLLVISQPVYHRKLQGSSKKRKHLKKASLPVIIISTILTGTDLKVMSKSILGFTGLKTITVVKLIPRPE